MLVAANSVDEIINSNINNITGGMSNFGGDVWIFEPKKLKILLFFIDFRRLFS